MRMTKSGFQIPQKWNWIHIWLNRPNIIHLRIGYEKSFPPVFLHIYYIA